MKSVTGVLVGWTRSRCENWIQSCVGCLSRTNDTHPASTEMQPILADAPWQTVVMNLVGPLTATIQGNKMDSHNDRPFY